MRIFISEHTGSPASPIVSAGDKVLAGEKIAESIGNQSLDYHASTSGEIAETGRVSSIFGRDTEYIDIIPDMLDRPHPSIVDMGEEIPHDKWEEFLKDSGILLKDNFPYPLFTILERFKNLEKKTLIINCLDQGIYGVNSETVLSEYFNYFIAGIKIIENIIKPEKIICIINTKIHQKYISELESLNMELLSLPDMYPASLPHVVARIISGEELFHKDLYLETEYLILNLETLFHTGQRIIRKLPYIETLVTVSGYGIARPQVLKARLGITMGELIKQAGGFIGTTGKIILNNIFNGVSIVNTDFPVSKTTASLIILPKDSVRTPEPMPCISCGKCVDHCPSSLEPVFLEESIDRNKHIKLQLKDLKKCCECGICSYICPSFRLLSEKIITARKRKL